MNHKTVYFPGLNGLRAIAAIAVVFSHITLNLGEFNLDPHIFGSSQDGNPKGLDLAAYGVSIFFVLSGFLITYLLQVEKEGQSIDVRKFYVRRILRIWPLYYLYLIIVLMVAAYHGMNIQTGTLLLYIFYAANIPFILNSAIPLLAHYWSLGVEEQFYLIWPWVNKKGKALVQIVLFSITVLIGVKVALHFLHPDSLMERAINVTRFHCMLIGALGALLYKNKEPRFLNFVNNKIAQIICWTIMFMLALNKYHIASVIDNEIISVVALMLIIGQIEVRNRIVNLETATFDYLGKISYGIYVIHPVVIFLFSGIFVDLEMALPLKYILVYMTIGGTTIVLSGFSYTYFEKYFLNFKKKYVVVDSASTKNEVG